MSATKLGVPRKRSGVNRFSAWVRWARLRGGITMEELAVAADRQRSWVADMERGRFAPKFPEVLLIGRALDCEMEAVHEYLFGLFSRAGVGDELAGRWVEALEQGGVLLGHEVKS